jgi:hypothetical protein
VKRHPTNVPDAHYNNGVYLKTGHSLRMTRGRGGDFGGRETGDVRKEQEGSQRYTALNRTAIRTITQVLLLGRSETDAADSVEAV